MSSRDPSRTSAITPLLFSLVFSSLFTWLFIRSMKWEAFENAFFHVKPLSLLLFIGLTICMISLRAFRSVLILNRLTGPRRSWVRLFSTSFIGFGAILLFPFRSGELVRPWLLASPRKSAGRRIRFSSLIGVSIFERVLDGLLVSFLLISAVSWLLLRSTAPGWVLPALLLTAGIFTTGAVILIFAVTHPVSTLRLARRITFLDGLSRRFTSFHRISIRFESLFHGMVRGFSTVSKLRPFLIFLFLSITYWGVNALSVWVLAQAFSLPLSLAGAISVMGFIVLGIFIPSLPAHIGNFHHFALLGLALFIPAEQINGNGKATIVALHGFQLLVYVVMALLGVAMGGLSKPKD